MNNLAEKDRPSCRAATACWWWATSWTIEGSWFRRRRAPVRWRAGARRPGCARGRPGWTIRGPGGMAVARAAPAERRRRRGSRSRQRDRVRRLQRLHGHLRRGEGVWLLPASRWADYRLPPQLLQRGVNHQQDWIRACKGGAPGVSHFAVATKYIEWLVLGAVALQVPGKLLWDSKNMRFSNSEEANKYLRPSLRKGWEMKL